MDHSLKLTVSETIDAPASAVWKALTDKEMIKKYFFGTEAVSDWKAGSPLIFKGVWEGQKYEEKGTILEIETERLLKYSYLTSGLEDKPENYAAITYRLNAEKEQTVLTVVQEGFRDREAYDHSDENWREVLKGLKSLVEA